MYESGRSGALALDADRAAGALGHRQAGMGGAHRLDLGHDVGGEGRDLRPGHVDMQRQRFRGRRQPAVGVADFLIGAQPLVVVVEQLEGDRDLVAEMQFRT